MGEETELPAGCRGAGTRPWGELTRRPLQGVELAPVEQGRAQAGRSYAGRGAEQLEEGARSHRERWS